MSVIAIKGIPAYWNLKGLKFQIAKTKFKSGYEVLNFDKPRGNFKTGYIRITGKIDPRHMIEKINRLTNVKNAKLVAFIPNYVPDLPMASKKIAKKANSRKGPRATGQTYEWILEQAHRELFEELLYKNTRLMELSKKTGHKLLDEIAETLFRRVKQVMMSNSESTVDCFNLTKAYRKKHPHFADFQLVLSTLHRLEDASGAPRTQLAEAELVAASVDKYVINDIPFQTVEKICNKYADRVLLKVTEYVQGLEGGEASPAADTSPEDSARLRVRFALKKMAPYFDLIIKQVIQSTFIPESSSSHKMRVYGEPFLPPKDLLEPALRKHGGVQANRSARLYNLCRFSAQLNCFAKAMELDGAELGGAKLVVRPSTEKEYSFKPQLMEQMRTAFQKEAMGTPMDY